MAGGWDMADEVALPECSTAMIHQVGRLVSISSLDHDGQLQPFVSMYVGLAVLFLRGHVGTS